MNRKRSAGLKGQHVVVIGNGVAGNSAIAAVRAYDRDAVVTLISREAVPLYSPCAFYKHLSGEMEKQKLFLKKKSDYRKEKIEVVFGQKAEAVNVKDREVLVGDKSIPFDKLILAVGSRTLIPPIKGVDKGGVFSLKTMADLEAIMAWPASKVAVIGSGPIGMEAAIAFRKRGLEVSVIELLSRLLPRLFDEEPAMMLRRIVEGHGIKVFTEEKVTEILGDGAVKGLATDKRELGCDTVIVAAGVTPNTDLARQMGLGLGDLGGIKTDDYMMTSVEGIYACGDCVESKDIITGQSTLSLLWHNAKRQGRVSGSNCLGERRRFIGSFDATSVEMWGTRALSVGRSSACFSRRGDYDIIERSFDSSYYRLIIESDRLVGMQLINKGEHAGLLFSRMLRRDNIVELGRVIKDDKLLAMKPWQHWIRQYIS